uniref:GYF domain-containing protein n=1 Tax=Angiostrongylus cantonensis TaxID=6313 RepID=A0A0K0DNM0_ANGCA
MTSTSPIATTPAVGSPQQNSFHPSWMRSVFNGGGNGTPTRSTKAAADNSASAPVFVKNRYGREDMLALMGDAAGHRAPEGLRDCPFYVEEALQPIVCYPLSDLEQRLQQNINSSKAMASLSHAERANIATGAAYSGSTDGGTASQKASTGGWTSVKQWNRNHPNTGSARGTSFPRVYGSSGRNTTRGDGTNISQDHSQLNSFGQRFATRGRGALALARGGAVSGTTFNSRAQGLYDPRDPKDRPRLRMRSTSDEGEVVGEGSWTISPSGKHCWGNDSKDPSQINIWSSGQGDTASSISEVPEESLRKNESGPMPEWMEDGEDQEKGESGDDTISATGSFDEHGRFQKKHYGPLGPSEEKAPGVNRDRCEKQQATNIENYNKVSSIEKKTSQQMSGDPNFSSAQTHVLNSDPATSHGYSNVLSQAEAVGYQPSVTSQPSVGTVPAVVPNSIHQGASQFFYLDPTKQERGPFEKMQMDSWYKRGYFTEALEVRRHHETTYRTLGELVQLNGQLTPFDFKDDISCQPSVTPVFSNPAPPFAALFASGTGTMWNELGNPSSMIYNQTSYDRIAVERKRIGDEQRRILQEQAKMREYQEHLIREMQKQREEQEKQLLEQKLALMKHQEEIERRERELKESAEETKARLEMERLALAEKARQLEEERGAKIQVLNN